MPEPTPKPIPQDVDAIVAETMARGYQLAKETSHKDFAEAVKNNKMIYDLQLSNPIRIIKHSHKLIFSIYITMYLLVPAITISIFAYQKSNWLLLTGILLSALGSLLAARSPKVGFFLTILLFGAWAATEFHIYSFPFFYLVCMWWGYVWYNIADAKEIFFIKNALLTDSELYKKLADNNLLFILKEPELNG